MIVNNVAKIAESKNKNVRQVSQETGLRYNTVLNLFRGSATRLDLETMDAVCRVLDAQPGDLFQWASDPLESPG